MWKKGILTDTVKERVINMTDSGYALDIWAESSEKMLRERKKILEKFKEQLLSPMLIKKRIIPDFYLEDIFEDGDIVAFQLQTKEEVYVKKGDRDLTDEKFHTLDGKYVIVQKIWCCSSKSSLVVPEVKDHWAIFRLFDGVFNEIPESVDVSKMKNAKFVQRTTTFNGKEYKKIEEITPLFLCESNMFYFKRRKYKVIGNAKEEVVYGKKAEMRYAYTVYFGLNNDEFSADSELISAMEKEVEAKLFEGDPVLFFDFWSNGGNYIRK